MISPRSAQAASTESRSAMSAMLQPAAMSGRKTCTSWRERTSAVSAMKWTPQKTMDRHDAAFGGKLAEPEAVAAEIGEPDDFVLLVMVPENQQRIAQSLFYKPDSPVELFVLELSVRFECQRRNSRRR